MALFERLLPRMQELKDLSGLVGLATWDQETYMPPRADAARAAQQGTLQSILHERLIDPALGELLEQAQQDASLEPDQRVMAQVLKRDRDREVKIPARLVRELAEAQSHGLSAWRQARKEKNFKVFAPKLAVLLKLRREQADAWGHGGERYDALLENYEPGMRVSRLTPVLSSLKDQLIPFVAALRGRAPVAGGASVFANKAFDVDAQWRVSIELLKAMGFDLEAGRQDKSIHPFTGGTHPQDVRLTTRLQEDNPLPALFGTIHEGGHGLYEQGFSEAHWRTPLAAAPSMGIHESQSRLWENVVGRSRAFWTHWFPKLRAAFPAQLGTHSLEEFYAAVNRVEPSMIRVEADEVTYNLHIVLRYELELLLLRDALPLEDLPEAWDSRMQSYLGIRPKHVVEGVLQDIHWAWGELGYFPTYALGNLYSASLYEGAKRQVPGLEAGISRGELLPLRDWLRKNIHSHGYRQFAEDRVRAVTGDGLTDKDFIRYLKTKYSELYGIAI